MSFVLMYRIPTFDPFWLKLAKYTGTVLMLHHQGNEIYIVKSTILVPNIFELGYALIKDKYIFTVTCNIFISDLIGDINLTNLLLTSFSTHELYVHISDQRDHGLSWYSGMFLGIFFEGVFKNVGHHG